MSLITKVAPVPYDPTARSDLWDEFVARVLPDADVRRFVQRAAGYSLIGANPEEVLFFTYGPSVSNGAVHQNPLFALRCDRAGVAGAHLTTASVSAIQAACDYTPYVK